MRIVGLDLSLCATGWCELHVGKPSLHFGTIKPPKGMTGVERLTWLVNEIIPTADQTSVEKGGLVVIEGFSFGSTGRAHESGGLGWLDTERHIDIPVWGVTAKSHPMIGSAAGHVRVGHAFERGNWYVRPMVDTGLMYVFQQSFQEHGAGGANLHVDRHDKLHLTLQAALEGGTEFALADGTLFRPRIKLGVTQYLTDTDSQMRASFAGAPAGTG